MLMAEAKGLECQCRGIGTGSQSDEVGAFVFSAFLFYPFNLIQLLLGPLSLTSTRQQILYSCLLKTNIFRGSRKSWKGILPYRGHGSGTFLIIDS